MSGVGEPPNAPAKIAESLFFVSFSFLAMGDLLFSTYLQNNDPGQPQVNRTGRCIYCGSEKYSDEEPDRELGREHVIPEGMGGPLFIQNASCRKCEREINKFESSLLKTTFYAPRVHLGITRKRRKRSKEFFTIDTGEGNESATVVLPLENIPVTLIMPWLFAPYIFYEEASRASHATIAGALVQFLAGDFKNIREKYGSDSIRMKTPDDLNKFCRFLAKIAYSYALGALFSIGIKANCKPLLHPIIFNQATTLEEMLNFVGGLPESEPDSEFLHELSLFREVIRGANYLVVRIRLFANLGCPTYYVVAAKESAL